MALVPCAELERRRVGLQSGLREQGIDAALIVQPVDLYYFTGTLQQAHLIVPAEGEPTLLVRRDLRRAPGGSLPPLRGTLPRRHVRRLLYRRARGAFGQVRI
jgi:Xaa-Pro dipeptidase